MTEKLYDKDSFIKEFTATVIDSYPKADGFFTILDNTAFFPEGGGQPADTGYINDSKVYDVQINDGIIYHYTTKQFEKGEEVTSTLNFSRRFDFMQQHSGEHIMSGIAHSLYGCENVGFHLSDDIVTLDFDKPLSDEQISEIEKGANQKIFQNVEFITYYPDKDTLKSLNYRSKKELEGDIRIVEIENTDMCACCAPHVKTAGQIGIIKVISREKLRGGVRLEIKCGSRALKDYNIKQSNITAISSALCVKPEETAMAVERLLSQLSELKFKITDIKRKSVLEKVENFETQSEITAEFYEDLEIKDLQHIADLIYKKCGGLRAVFSQSDNGFCFCICSDSDKLDSWFKNFKSTFNVRGGGRNGMVQGTVFASKDDLIEFFN